MRRHSRRRSAVLALSTAATLTLALALPAAADPAVTRGGAAAGENPVVSWNAVAGRAAAAACIAPLDDPLHESRMYAITQVAVHDVLNAIDRRSRPYAYTARADRHASVPAAVAAAAHDSLVATIAALPFPQQCRDAGLATVEAAYADALAGIPDGRSKSRGLAVGRSAAAAIVRLRAGDGADTPLVDPAFPQGTEPGEYRFTPGTPFVFLPGWGDLTPFTLRSAAQFQVGTPPALTSTRYARDVNEVQRLGGDGVTTPSARTAEQTQIALYWWGSLPLLWNRIGRDVATRRGLDPWASARLFGLVNLAMADSYVASFDLKYRELFWRPVTAIQEADHDGNPRTHADPTWTPLRTTPPIPEYDSAHAVVGAAAAAAVRRFVGTDRVSFSACSDTLPPGQTCSDAHPVVRHFGRLSDAAEENGDSRVYIGFHFRTSARRGIAHGSAIGDHVVERFLTAVRAR